MVLATIVLVDSIFFAALAPMLPDFRSRLEVSEMMLGFLSGAYAAGTLIGSLPGGWLAARWGAVRIITVGLGLLCVASLAFAFGDSLGVLVAARFVQGLGGACSWVGALSWAISIVPENRRGRAIGNVMGVGFAGALLGPVVGTLARQFGLAWPVCVIAALALVLIWIVHRLPAPPQAEHRSDTSVGVVFRRGLFRQGAALIFVAALIAGALSLAVPLRIDHLGGGGLVLGAAFLVAGAAEAAGQRVAGGIVDGMGPRRPILWSLLIGSMLLAAMGGLTELWIVASVSVLAIVAFGIVYTPATSLMYTGVDEIGADPSFAAAIVNLTWAGGQAFGAVSAGAVSDYGPYGVPFLLIATVGFGAAALVALRVGRVQTMAEPREAEVRGDETT